MTKKDLIKALENMPDDAEVYIGGKYNSVLLTTIAVHDLGEDEPSIHLASPITIGTCFWHDHVIKKEAYFAHFRNNFMDIIYNESF